MKNFKNREKAKTFFYMLAMVLILILANQTVSYATEYDDDVLADSVLSNEPNVDENRTNIDDPGTAETADDLKELNIAQNLTITYDNGNGELNGSLRILLILTALSLIPFLLITITSFTRILIVLSFTRQALNTTSAPPTRSPSLSQKVPWRSGVAMSAAA